MKSETRVIATVLAGSLAVAIGTVLAANTALAQQARPPMPDMGALASEMGVPEDALAACMGPMPGDAGPPPQGQGQAPQGEPPARPDATEIATCLSEAGHAITAETVDSALGAGAPPER